MACGCLDKENDAKIIAEVNRRKDSKYVYDYFYEDFLYEGDLQVAVSMVDQIEIEQITRNEDNFWRITLKKSLPGEKV